MVTEHFEFAGLTDNLRLANDQVEVVILREAGPRIISLRPLNGFNVFKVVAEESGKSQEETWKIRGGHRLWTAPEDYGDPNGLTYVVDNFPVEYEIKGEFHAQVTHFMQKPAQIRRDISVQLAAGGPKITVEHSSPGETAKHTEIWAVFSGIRLPHLYDEEGFAEAIDPYLKQLL